MSENEKQPLGAESRSAIPLEGLSEDERHTALSFQQMFEAEGLPHEEVARQVREMMGISALLLSPGGQVAIENVTAPRMQNGCVM